MSDEKEIRIAHISDLHFTSRMKWPPQNPNDPWAACFRALKDDMEEQRPHAIVVTGDIADNAAWEQADGSLNDTWNNAKEFLKDVSTMSIQKNVGTTSIQGIGDSWRDRVFVVPGNHDARILGNVSREKLGELADTVWFSNSLLRRGLAIATKKLLSRHGRGELYDQIEPIFERKFREALQALPSDSTAFKKTFAEFIKSRYIRDLNLFVFCVDSNFHKDSYLNFAQGEVAYKEAEDLRQTARKWNEAHPEFENAYKLVLMHHHPMPMPFAEVVDPGREGGDEFLLLRNAGSFMRVCGEEHIDFILHGHKHVKGNSLVSFPDWLPPYPEDHQMIVVGAGSVYKPFSDVCSYNLLRYRENGEWWLNLHERPGKGDSVDPYRCVHETLLAPGEWRRRRLYQMGHFPIRVGCLDIIASITETGDFKATFYAKDVTPWERTSRLDSYPFCFVSESKRATLEAKGFEDTRSESNAVGGDVKLRPPLEHGQSRDVEIGIHGIGVYTFSQEYCRLYKGIGQEEFSLEIAKSYDELHISIDFPDGFEPIEPELQVLRPTKEGDFTQSNYSTDELIRRGEIEIDQAEMTACRNNLRFFPSRRRILFQVHKPLPKMIYRILWRLPNDEYEYLADNDSGEYSFLRSRARAAIGDLHKRLLSLEQASVERGHVSSFLEKAGKRIVERLGVQEAVRVDLAANDRGKIAVVAAIQRHGETWTPSALRPKCNLGETLRGKAYLQRLVCYYNPGTPDKQKDPKRDPIEEQIKHQVSIPVVYPLARPSLMPRIGVFTLSSEETNSTLFDVLKQKNTLEIYNIVHEELIILAQKLGTPLPYVGGPPVGIA